MVVYSVCDVRLDRSRNPLFEVTVAPCPDVVGPDPSAWRVAAKVVPYVENILWFVKHRTRGIEHGEDFVDDCSMFTRICEWTRDRQDGMVLDAEKAENAASLLAGELRVRLSEFCEKYGLELVPTNYA